MMIAAIYARKSTEQNGADADAKSVARQIENARAFAASKGWTVVDQHVYADDAVSGAETKKLVNRERLLQVIRTRPPFKALILRDTSRFSRRDGDEVFSELKAIAWSGVEVWFYQDGQRFKFGTMGDNIVGFVKAEAAADYRRQIAAWTAEAMERKARAGHVTGNRVFGYDNVRVNGHVERRANAVEAEIVRRIYELYAAGQGLPTIAHTLNADGAACPRAQQGRVNGWCPSSVRAILKRPLYRGEIVYGRAKKRDESGKVRPSMRAPKDWLRVAAPDLAIVSETLAASVDARFASMRSRALRQANGRLMGRPPGEGSPYLLTGLLTYGGGMEVLSSASGRRRLFHYRCYVSRRKGAAICANRLPAPMADADAAVLQLVEDTLLNPAVVERALVYAEAGIARERSADQRETIEADLAAMAVAVRRLTAAIAAGGELAPLVAALQTYEQQRRDLEARLAAIDAPHPVLDPDAVRAQLQSYLVDWQGLLRANVQQGKQILRRLIKGRLTFTPRDGYYEFRGVGTVRPLLAGVVRKLVPHAHQLEPDDCVAPPNRRVAARSVNICGYFGNLDDAGGVRAHVMSDWPAQSCRNLLAQRCRAEPRCVRQLRRPSRADASITPDYALFPDFDDKSSASLSAGNGTLFESI